VAPLGVLGFLYMLYPYYNFLHEMYVDSLLPWRLRSRSGAMGSRSVSMTSMPCLLSRAAKEWMVTHAFKRCASWMGSLRLSGVSFTTQ